VAGPNDGGKTALLDALAFLMGSYHLDDADRSYLPDSGTARCAATSVEGRFTLDEWEQETFHLPAESRIRRISDAEGTRLECWSPLPADERLRDLAVLKAAALAALVREFGLEAATTRKADSLAALQAYAAEHSAGEDWLPATRELADRLPRLLQFGGNVAEPNQAVKAALTARFQTHVKDPDLQGQLTELEREVQDRLRADSKSLCDHIKHRCPDLTEVSVEPDVSFTQSFRSANLQIMRNSTGPVELTRSGLGSGRRISLAIWEWTSELLSEENASEPEPEEHGESAPSPVQTIIVYDEPDTHLDYAHQRKVMSLILDQSKIPHVNVIVATHSMNLIDGVDIADVVHVRLTGGATTIERLGTESHGEIDRFLGKIATSVGLRNSVLLHERLFLAVEGATEQQAFPHLFRLSTGLSLQAAGIALWACDNNEGALHLAKYLVEHGRTVKVMIDADSRDNKIFQEISLLRNFGPRAREIVDFVGEDEGFREFEELFPDELWARVADERWPRGTSWSPEDFGIHRGRKFSGAVQQMLQTGSETGPTGKPAMMVGLALSLRGPDEVPRQLREAFDELEELASQ
jgi:energy-coupling factor transporter ATP-binding protein EcfA2